MGILELELFLSVSFFIVIVIVICITKVFGFLDPSQAIMASKSLKGIQSNHGLLTD
jgi:hypothetical protein